MIQLLKHCARAAVVFIALLSHYGAHAERNVLAYYGEPPYSITLWSGETYVSIGGEVSISGLEHYDFIRDYYASVDPAFPYYKCAAKSGSIYDFKISASYFPWKEGFQTGLSLNTGMGSGFNNIDTLLPMGWYPSLSFSLERQYINTAACFSNSASLSAPVWSSSLGTSILIPKQSTMPIHISPNTQAQRFGDTVWAVLVGASYVENALTQASLIGSNANELYDGQSQCPMWLTGGQYLVDLAVDRVASRADFNKLKPGLNLVSDITWCGEAHGSGSILGCASDGGNIIVLNISKPHTSWPITILHEYGHNVELDDRVDDGSNNFMTGIYSPSNTKKASGQCLALQYGVNYY